WIPPEILKSRERLPDMEFNIIKKHPTYGHGIAKQSGLEDTVILNSILYHHEQWDGNGYNEGKKGEEIPFESRLMMVADVYDALTTIRPYKRAWSPYEATTFLIQETKKKFDPFIVNLFLKVFGLYPVGTHVALSSGHTGVVVGNKTGAVSRPLVRLNDGQNTILDMFVDRGVFIKQVLSDTSQLVVN
ncbi:MAG TPA: HD domain-containing phosphohydrolase, partial [Thermotogota bacterium]|nr:HD domain-containing phosphohydrolase [Thermotogota bacterium]HQN22023.1 HD domain-containing phosphohydrolase [Thermotogota bacterium]HQQ65746.1 HD domain-containing phosphohydrolase [Thermotogota bacterium]